MRTHEARLIGCDEQAKPVPALRRSIHHRKLFTTLVHDDPKAGIWDLNSDFICVHGNLHISAISECRV